MRIHYSLAEWQKARSQLDHGGQSIGFVPTMGALHPGHRALLARARADNDRVVLSIFVNPTQFNDPTDLAKYPRTLDQDMHMARDLVDDVILPKPEEMYADNYHYRVTEADLSRQLEGAHRPGHFDGVLTVVMKLLNVVRAHRAYFGEKDWQQLRLIEGMAQAFFLPVEIVACATERAPDGLALSSRNRRLSPAARAQAAQFPKVLRTAPNAAAAAAALAAAGFIVDYVEDHSGIRLGAVRIDNVRLIDNVRI